MTSPKSRVPVCESCHEMEYLFLKKGKKKAKNPFEWKKRNGREWWNLWWHWRHFHACVQIYEQKCAIRISQRWKQWIKYNWFQTQGSASSSTWNNCVGNLRSISQGTTVYFSVEIDRENVSPAIVRTMCDVWRTIKSVIFVTDVQNVVSLWSVEGQTNLVDRDVWGRCVSVRSTYPHMYSVKRERYERSRR